MWKDLLRQEVLFVVLGLLMRFLRITRKLIETTAGLECFSHHATLSTFYDRSGCSRLLPHVEEGKRYNL